MKKKILSLVLALAMLVSLIPCSFAAFEKTNTYSSGQFSDVAEGDWFAKSVATAYELGLIKGSSDTTFNPKGNITVAETVALACRLHNIYNGGSGEFTQGSPWYQVYVDYALENKLITNMYSDYNAKISRANFAYILVNALPADELAAINNISDGELYDVADDYKKNAIYTLYRAGVLSGNDEFGTFNPDSTILRSEVAAIITRMADKTERKTFTLKRKTTVSADIYRAALVYANMTFAQSYGIDLSTALDTEVSAGMTGADILHDQALSLVSEFDAIRLFALDNGLKLTDADKKAIENTKNQQYAYSGGKDAFIASLKAEGLNAAFFDYLTESQFWYDKLSEIFAMDGKYGMNSEEASKILSENYVRVKHILITADASSSDYATKKALATKVAQRAAKGEDFDALISEFGEDPGMTSNPDGYIFDKYGYTPDGSQMVEEFTNASVALKVGGVSGVVPSAYGFHIIRRYPMNEEFISSYLNENAESFMFNALTTTLSQYISRIVISNQSELEAIDIASVFGK